MEDNAELESFRRQWREEVTRRTKSAAATSSSEASQSAAAPSPAVAAANASSKLPSRRAAGARKDLAGESSLPNTVATEELTRQIERLRVTHEHTETEEDVFTRRAQEEPESALEHFERAVEKEAAGNLGDSLQHYRKAYRLDAGVDKAYRNKHYSHSWKKPVQPALDDLAPSVKETSAVPTEEQIPLPTAELIESFACLPVPGAEPLIEGDVPPPCPIANIPSEVLIEVLRHVALMDPAALARMSLVCKRFAYHFAHEQSIWKDLCQHVEFGLQGMHYTFACDGVGHPLHKLDQVEQYTPFPVNVPAEIPKPLSSWSQVFQCYPRIRFTGIYISTVNYSRPGEISSFQTVSWNSPIHIVTYYRYLRFYPDGSVVSLLTTTEPVDVVPYISTENVLAARPTTHKSYPRHASSDQGHLHGGSTEPVPSVAINALKHGLRGRWRLASPFDFADDPEDHSAPPSAIDKSPSFDPRDVIVETEGVDPKYRYTMHLSLRSSSVTKAHPNPPRNTKLAWRGFWSYNQMTDDWGEFGLRNDRPYVFRRVRGWGLK
ncbi:hypothetical protein N7539_005589 [Penicillium diatomitis]|uniref:F-box domain-containing protein n=1 Tax=Penicillium diatomitis TaxID=2819901 RepID=A0A9W9X7P4_9EURO|nr:uncharacterized protein N7539_005589 [Penicillium diatomitis]KAJ5485601.1 hypothetical protein N7539_005589 [Penicillium diatomitis]